MSSLDLLGDQDKPVIPKTLKLVSKIDLFGLVDGGLNTSLYHWVNGKYYNSFELGRYCDGLKIMLLDDDKFLVWISCYKDNAKRPLFITYDSETKEQTSCVLNSKLLTFDFNDFSYSRLTLISDQFLLYIKDTKSDRILQAQMSIDPKQCQDGQ